MYISFAGSLISCARISQGYKIEPESSVNYPPTNTVEIIETEPEQPFKVIATFIGNETGPEGEGCKFCQLEKQGKKIGANAAWIQKKTIIHNPEQWFFIRDKMEKMKAIDGAEYEGRFIRYTEPEKL